LPTAQPDAALTDESRVAVREADDEIMGLGRFRRLFNLLLGSVAPSRGDILADGAAKKR